MLDLYQYRRRQSTQSGLMAAPRKYRDRREEEFSRSQEDLIDLDYLNHRKAVLRTNFLQHAMNMVLDGLFGKVQLRRNLFVGEALRNQRHQLLLAAS